jgi:hypothetical protein
MMRKLFLGAAAAAVALSVVPAQAAPTMQCADGFEAVCLVIALPCIVAPKYFACPA